MYTFSSIEIHITPKRFKCTHSATKFANPFRIWTENEKLKHPQDLAARAMTEGAAVALAHDAPNFFLRPKP